eukprot:5204208-Karenia_brevis.AAC.1
MEQHRVCIIALMSLTCLYCIAGHISIWLYHHQAVGLHIPCIGLSQCAGLIAGVGFPQLAH